MQVLGARLAAAAALIGRCDTFVDVGANHGYLGAYMLLEGRCESAVFADISEKALERARGLIQRLRLENRASFFVGDGLQGIALTKGDGVAICGMGARTIVSILSGKKLPCRAVLQSNVEVALLRRFLLEHDLKILSEAVVFDRGRFYALQLVEPGRDKGYTDGELVTGKPALYEDKKALEQYLDWRMRVCGHALRGARAGSDEEKLTRALLEYEAVRLGLEALKVEG